ncbi:MAG: hypothetical protein LC772_03875 [Chloroflexi bacterium]|nr:hypothetical protein [Chloroflexota bacterium]
MDRTLFRYDEPYGRPRRKGNLFGGTIAILLLSGLTLAAWLGSFYIFGQPERPDSYRILQKLHKIEPPKRFQLTAAPAGEFLNPQQLHDRYGAMRPAELAKKNAELARNYIRNFQQVAGLVPYLVGRFTIMEARELGRDDLFTSGMAALTSAIDYGELLLEHVYPADEQSVPLMKETLGTGLEIKLDRAHDLSAVIHAECLTDGRVLVTAVPLLYGSYTVTQGRGMFSLEPPYNLNLRAGWPLFKEGLRRAAETRYATARQQAGLLPQGIPLPGLAPTPGPVAAANELIRVEPAVPIQQPAATPFAVASKENSAANRGKLPKNEKASPAGAAISSAAPGAVAAKAPVSSTPMTMAAATVTATRGTLPDRATPVPSAGSSPFASRSETTARPGQPVTVDTALASTAGGASWKTYPPGKMPAGRLITTSDLGEMADRGLAGERIYLRGQFVVNFAEANRAVLRPRSGMAETVLHLGALSSTRIIVEFPSGSVPPAQGSTVNRDEARPYEITEIRKQSDGQLNVFVREIMQ